MAESNDSEFHVKELNRYCRVRAGVVENTYTYICHEETNKTLLQNFGIDVDKDQPNIHPKYILLVLPSYCYEGHSVFRVYSEHLEGVSVDPTH